MKENKKILYTGVALLLAAVIAIAAILAAVLPGTRTAPSPMGQLSADPQESGRGISLVTEPIAREEYDEYGISPAAENAYTVTAKVKTDDGFYPDEYQKIDFSLKWKNPIAENVTEYVSLSSEGVRATVSLIKPFNVQVILTAASTLDPSKTAEVTFDYVKQFTGYSIYTADSLTNGPEGPNYIQQYCSLKKITANEQVVKIHLANITTQRANYGLGYWGYQIISFPSSAEFGGVGSVENSVTAVAYSLKYTETFLRSYNVGNSHPFETNALTDYPLSQWHLLHDMMRDSGGTRAPDYYFGDSISDETDGTVTRNILNALDEADKPIEVTVTLTLQYGEPIVLHFYLDVEVEPIHVESVETEHDSYFFGV